MDVEPEGEEPSSGTGAEDPPQVTAGRAHPAVRRSRTVSTLMDGAVRVPGTGFRVGIDPLLGLVPFGGDTVAFVLSLYPVVEAARLGLPRSTLARMLLNVGVDFLVGSVPVLGTLFDAVWKANERNVRLMERHLD